MQQLEPTLHIDVYLDLICPWCLIGKKNLERALAKFTSVPGHPSVQVHWRSVQLIPDLPTDGVDFEAFYQQRLGSVERMRARQAQVRAAAGQAGTEVRFDRIRRFPNTLLAHRMLAYAKEQLSSAQLDALLDALLVGYFQQGADIGDEATLSDIGSRHGLDHAAWKTWMAARPPKLERAISVPLFVFNRGMSLSGAQPADVLLEAMGDALAATRIPID
ncbi:DsbA family oxidoreductase [Variovorax sp. J22R133]|uniref:DsbA family oxidoreductase n=1 Tax=Variovorax brevis TaxID=3053503 RepID=UPI002577DC53|nr:DsbA family oxidoreductase [Variovorax sp. J22R133]MDM0116969.1 DsbA family oxidoreductase [Variovorax sp. J22R133]